MTDKAPLAALLALCSCAIDDRVLTVRGACVTPPADGLVADFSAAVPGTCGAGFCTPGLVGRPTVVLGKGDISGIVLPYGSSGLNAIGLDVASTMPGDAGAGQALRAGVSSGSLFIDASTAYEGFALQFTSCVDISGYVGVSFTAAGNLGSCALRFAAEFKAADAGTFSTPCAIDDCHATSNVAVGVGTTTLPFAVGGSVGDANVLAGLQWEVAVPSDPPGGCHADFTIDDIRLVLASP